MKEIKKEIEKEMNGLKVYEDDEDYKIKGYKEEKLIKIDGCVVKKNSNVN
jgi:predicted secreted Zn-dependent protease